ncbi:MAG: hypothetical protein ABI675_26960 [Chitinophagaceae bacterium]
MKKQFSLYKLGVIPLIILCCSVNAQTTGLNANLNTSSSKEVAMNDDKELPAFSSYSAFTAKAVKNFSKNFKDADNAGWAATIDGYKAEFTKEGIETKVFYNRKGQWVASVRNYFEDKLPRDIRHQVKSKYYDYNIFYVQEITVGEKMTYLVKIEDKDSIKTIRLADGEMEEYLAFEKSK